MNDNKSETASEALARYQKESLKVFTANPDDEENLKNNFELTFLTEDQVTFEALKEIENHLNITLPEDYKNFVLQVGNFKIGRQDEDEFGDYNSPVLCSPLRFIRHSFYDIYTNEVDELLDENSEDFEGAKNQINTLLPIFSQGSAYFNYHFVCYETLSYNDASREMSLAYFHYANSHYYGTKTTEVCQDIHVFDKFISEFIDEKLCALSDRA